MAESAVHTFDDITERLDEIVATVRSKDTSLERSLDLFDEAIKLGSRRSTWSIRSTCLPARRISSTRRKPPHPRRATAMRNDAP